MLLGVETMSINGELAIALVGCGGMAKNYRRRYTQVPGARLALLVDADEETARSAAEELSVEKWSTRYEEVLSPEIDVVDISTPNFLHAEQALAAIRAGKNIIMQKPITPTVQDAEAIIQEARKMGVQVGMYMSMFDDPLYYEVKEMIKAGVFGTISSIHCRGAHRGGLRALPGAWRSSKEKTGGGAFIQLTVHNIDMIQWLLDDHVARVCAFSKNMMCPNIGGDDVTSAACEFESGIQGTLEAGYCADADIITIYGTAGFITILNSNFITIKLDQPYQGRHINYTEPGKIVATQAIGINKKELRSGYNPYDQHIAFIKALMEGRPVPISADVGLYDLKVVQAVYTSAEEKRFVDVK